MSKHKQLEYHNNSGKSKRSINILIILCCAVVTIGCALWACNYISSYYHKRNTLLYQEIKSVDKMVFASMSITKTVVNDQENIAGRRIVGYVYDNYARAYIDLSTLQPEDIEFNDIAKTVKIKLPLMETELIGRDSDMKEVYRNITGLRSNLKENEVINLKENGNIDFKKEWETNPMYKSHLKETAQKKARKYFESLFEKNGYTANIEFKESK